MHKICIKKIILLQKGIYLLNKLAVYSKNQLLFCKNGIYKPIMLCIL